MDRPALIVLLCLGSISSAFGAGQKWSHDQAAGDGPSHWPGVCQTGEKQSPIDIKGATQDKALGPFTLTNYDTKNNDSNFTVFNDGHGFKVAFPAKFYNVTAGGLPGTFTTAQFHIHWGKVDGRGSEHTVDEKEYAAELHFVSYNIKYVGIEESLPFEDGLAVLGVLIEVGGSDNPAFSFLNSASRVTSPKSSFTIEPFTFDPILPKNKTKYFRYSGSLTTPPCSEAVTWTVFKDPVKISERQVKLLRSLQKGNNKEIVDNYRPVMPLHGRAIKASFEVKVTTEPTTPTAGSSPIKMTAVLSLPVLLASFSFH